jgi:hypothetical protein
MKFARFVALIAAFTLLPLAIMVAKEKNQGKLQLTDPVQIGTTQLKPGNYKVEWTGTKPIVKVNFVQNDKTVASSSGRIIELSKPSPDDAVITKSAKSGQARRLEEIDFGNRTEALQIEPRMTSSMQHR